MSLAHAEKDPLSASTTAPQGESAPKWDIFVGYAYMLPEGTFYPIQQDGSILAISYKSEKVGLVESLTYYFHKNLGLQFDSGQHDLFVNTGFGSSGSSNSGMWTTQAGLAYRFPGVRFTPFIHGLGGAAYVDGPDHEPYTWGPTVTAGGGLDWNINHRWSIRLFQADYEFLHINSGVSHISNGQFILADDENVNAFRLGAGVVYHIGGGAPATPLTLTCAADPKSVYPGTPVGVTSTAEGLDPKLSHFYTWSGLGVTGNGSIAGVATATMAPGTYEVKGELRQGKPGKVGLKPGEDAVCAASYTVKAFEPPSIACRVDPTRIQPGENASITATALSPENRPLSYSYSASAGAVSGSGGLATFMSAGAPAGAVVITCSVTDDMGQSATSSTTLSIVAAMVAAAPRARPLCSIEFKGDPKRPTRVNNEAKACLDEVSLTLQNEPGATALMVGQSTHQEKAAAAAGNSVDPAAQRAVNAKAYVVQDTGIDSTRIAVATGTADDQMVENYLVPAGASIADIQGITPVNETIVKPIARSAGAATHVHKPAAKPKAKGAVKKTAGARGLRRKGARTPVRKTQGAKAHKKLVKFTR